MNEGSKNGVGITYTSLHHKEEGHCDTEEDRVGEDGEDPFCKITLRGKEKYNVLTDKSKEKSREKLKRPISQHVFGVKQKSALENHPDTPNEVYDLFIVFQIGGIDTCGGMRQKKDNKFYDCNSHFLRLLSFTLEIPKGFFDLDMLSSRNRHSKVVIHFNLCGGYVFNIS